MTNIADHRKDTYKEKTTRERFLKVVLAAIVVLLLGGCAATGSNVKGISSGQVARTGQYNNQQSYDYQGVPTGVTPYEFKYKRVRDYLKTAYRTEEGENT